MLFRQDAARLRRELSGKSFTARPRCPTCQLEVQPGISARTAASASATAPVWPSRPSIDGRPAEPISRP